MVAGTTFGMMLANAPVVFFGDALTRRVPIKLVHGIAALIFAVLGVLTLLGCRQVVHRLTTKKKGPGWGLLHAWSG